MLSNDQVKWCRNERHQSDTNSLSKAEFTMRNKIVTCLSGWREAQLFAFGGTPRRSILSQHLIDTNPVLIAKLDAGEDPGDVRLPKDTFVPPGTDLDIYMSSKPDSVVVHLDSIVAWLKKKLSMYDISLRASTPHYTCHRVWVRTHPHPLAPVIRVQLDIVTGEGTLFPDFTCNQLGVNLRTGELSVFCPTMMVNPWCAYRYDLERIMQLPEEKHVESILGGAHDLRARAVVAIKEDIKKKIARVLLFSFKRWFENRACANEVATMDYYLTYVDTIVKHRLCKLLEDGFVITGFKSPIIDNSFVCTESGHLTPIRTMQIRCALESGDLVGVSRDVHEAKGGTDENNPGFSEDEDTDKDEDKDENRDTDEDDDEDTKPVFWCKGCGLYHDLVEWVL